ncbi:MAG: efflux RND transporter periplasmic adaptor subunit [Bacteroidetes bacterium]|nr:efflux RND transporter periplasmic adaptor subunit [Bacteroidota bacterium]MBS1757578.1 efflux RND transporter periplasmic adaptor subunit [Bacteroidota bacterium]
MKRVFYNFSQSFLILILVASCGNKKEVSKKAKQSPPTIVDVMVAQARPISNTVEANGTVLANEYLEIHPEVSGRLTYLNIAEGNPVSKGTVLARINDADLRAQLMKSKVQLELAQKTVDRYKQLLDVNGINQSDYDLAVNSVNGYKADMAYTQSLIDKTVIHAPFSGIIGLRQVSPGAYVTPATILATLQQTAKVKIDFTVPENYGNLVKKGDVLDVILDATTHEAGRAQVIAIEPGANTDTRNVKIRAILLAEKVNPGAFVKVLINAGKNNASIEVPANCIIPNDKNNQVIVVKNGRANFVNIEMGIRQANLVEITKGLSEGDTVVIAGVLFARPNSIVNIRSVKTLQQLSSADSTEN